MTGWTRTRRRLAGRIAGVVVVVAALASGRAAGAAYGPDLVFTNPLGIEDGADRFGERIALVGEGLLAASSARGIHLFDAATAAYLRTVALDARCVGGDLDGAACETRGDSDANGSCDAGWDPCPGGGSCVPRLGPSDPLAAYGSSKILVGAWGDERDGTVWLIDVETGLVERSFPRPADSPFFGSYVAVAGDHVVISGATGVWTYDGATGDLVGVIPAPADAVGFGVAPQVAGDALLVGGETPVDPGDPEGERQSAVWIFGKDDGALRGRIDGVGRAHASGGRVFASDPLRALLVATELDPSANFTPLRTFSHPGLPGCGETCVGLFGWEIAVAGRYVALSTPLEYYSQYGSVRLYLADDGRFVESIEAPLPSLNDYFGHSIAVRDEHVYVGSLPVAETVDNCPCAANPDQADGDHDGVGDACDPCPDDPEDACAAGAGGTGSDGPPAGPAGPRPVGSGGRPEVYRFAKGPDPVPAFVCYQAAKSKPSPGIEIPVFGGRTGDVVADALGTRTSDMRRVKGACAPADTGTEIGAEGREVHLVGYDAKTKAPFAEAALILPDGFGGEIGLRVIKPDRVLLPASSAPGKGGAPAPTQADVGAFQCFKVAATTRVDRRNEAITDGYGGAGLFEIGKPTRLCAAASVNGGLAGTSPDPLLCYKAKLLSARFGRRDVSTRDAFGPLGLELKKLEEVCLPARAG